jgi:copper ion binding protein
MKIATFRVKDMTCGHCVQAVSTEVRRIPGVSNVLVDLASGAVTVSSDPSLDPQAVRDAVVEAGYELVKS